MMLNIFRNEADVDLALMAAIEERYSSLKAEEAKHHRAAADIHRAVGDHRLAALTTELADHADRQAKAATKHADNYERMRKEMKK